MPMHRLLVILMLVYATSGFCQDNSAQSNYFVPTIVLDIEMLGDTSVESLKANDEALLTKYSEILRSLLKQHNLFDVIDDEESLAIIAERGKNQSLHRCNGCEFDLGNQLGAKLVVAPWIFRMSILIQTLVIEIRDVETGRLILKTPYNFRGNIDKAWNKTILYAVRDLKKTLATKAR